MNMIRTYLFVPATRPERIAKAFATGADAVIVDWEDSVDQNSKKLARDALLEHDNASITPAIWLRINAVDTQEYADDLETAKYLQHLQGIFLPKAESAADIAKLSQALNKPVIAVIETAKGMLNIAEIAQAKGLHSLSFGCLDLANDLGMRADSEAAKLIYNRLRTDLLLYSTLYRLAAPIETIYPAFNDHEGLREFTKHWRDLGFASMLCIHPSQVATIHETLQPSAKDLQFAQQVCEYYQQSGSASFKIEGQMVDMPVIKAAQLLLARYGA